VAGLFPRVELELGMLVVVGLVRFVSTALKAVQLLDELGGSRTLSQFHFGRLSL
jgi:hypothetical protein